MIKIFFSRFFLCLKKILKKRILDIRDFFFLFCLRLELIGYFFILDGRAWEFLWSVGGEVGWVGDLVVLRDIYGILYAGLKWEMGLIGEVGGGVGGERGGC